jgi:ABC-type nitrate/sulfonate/bicarbonate transport system ATPase subunit
MSRLALEGVVVRRGGRTILTVASLSLAAGETLALLGQNGAGKSTLLRAAGGLAHVSAGVRLLDGSPAGERELRRACAAVLQRPLLRRGTVLANACTGLRFHGVHGREAERCARSWLQRLGLGGLEARDVRTLSGGEAQRLSIARALALEPRVLLLDEPFASLDSPTRGDVLVDLRAALPGGTSVLLVTHEPHEAAALADRIAVLHSGELRQTGAAAAVLASPADADCARVLGYENVLVLDGRLVAVRAADVVIRAGGPARLERLVPLGPRLRAVCTLDGQTVVAELPPDAGLAPGDAVTLDFAPRRLGPILAPSPPAPASSASPTSP